MPSIDPPANQPPVSTPPAFDLPATGDDIANYMKRYLPYLHGARDIGEPDTLYLWDAANRAGLSYRNYGEFIASISEVDVRSLNERKGRRYPDVSPTVAAFAAKKSLEGHFCPTTRNFDLYTPDSMTTDSYKAAISEKAKVDPAVTSDNPDARFRGTSRFGAWMQRVSGICADVAAGKPDQMPNLSIIRLSNDHTSGINRNMPTPQFYVADNDYALGRSSRKFQRARTGKTLRSSLLRTMHRTGPTTSTHIARRDLLSRHTTGQALLSTNFTVRSA